MIVRYCDNHMLNSDNYCIKYFIVLLFAFRLFYQSDKGNKSVKTETDTTMSLQWKLALILIVVSLALETQHVHGWRRRRSPRKTVSNMFMRVNFI
jgi:hypothetical protein